MHTEIIQRATLQFVRQAAVATDRLLTDLELDPATAWERENFLAVGRHCFSAKDDPVTEFGWYYGEGLVRHQVGDWGCTLVGPHGDPFRPVLLFGITDWESGGLSVVNRPPRERTRRHTWSSSGNSSSRSGFARGNAVPVLSARGRRI
ncbi:hypothetical protein B841_02650 [Corynebacterium maris DSM 45190]|uniref:Uncharacterized protein n=2 Tax=Corynebacterium TaxID=1716 RepID=S5TH67_9CORY|nr:hypothetical protein B841_02650 [Corynebacterium maris DSM 45190]